MVIITISKSVLVMSELLASHTSNHFMKTQWGKTSEENPLGKTH